MRRSTEKNSATISSPADTITVKPCRCSSGAHYPTCSFSKEQVELLKTDPQAFIDTFEQFLAPQKPRVAKYHDALTLPEKIALAKKHAHKYSRTLEARAFKETYYFLVKQELQGTKKDIASAEKLRKLANYFGIVDSTLDAHKSAHEVIITIHKMEPAATIAYRTKKHLKDVMAERSAKKPFRFFRSMLPPLEIDEVIAKNRMRFELHKARVRDALHLATDAEKTQLITQLKTVATSLTVTYPPAIIDKPKAKSARRREYALLREYYLHQEKPLSPTDVRKLIHAADRLNQPRDLSSMNLTGCDLTRIDLRHTKFDAAKMDGITIDIRTTKIKGATLAKASITAGSTITLKEGDKKITKSSSTDTADLMISKGDYKGDLFSAIAHAQVRTSSQLTASLYRLFPETVTKDSAPRTPAASAITLETITIGNIISLLTATKETPADCKGKKITDVMTKEQATVIQQALENGRIDFTGADFSGMTELENHTELLASLDKKYPLDPGTGKRQITFSEAQKATLNKNASPEFDF